MFKMHMNTLSLVKFTLLFFFFFCSLCCPDCRRCHIPLSDKNPPSVKTYNQFCGLVSDDLNIWYQAVDAWYQAGAGWPENFVCFVCCTIQRKEERGGSAVLSHTRVHVPGWPNITDSSSKLGSLSKLEIDLDSCIWILMFNRPAITGTHSLTFRKN